ncbi:MAG: pyridoxal 5'-phosphate synthase glutaminase subunit PdxT [Dehalococcoidales bacterium]|nr:pyridoxal 5'-phosphate synthase glutaminase subunit PdxT [Dehalococcoidales bacterium]
MKIGVLASQGAFIEHITALKKLDIDALPVRLPGELKGVDGLILPGGESTTISKLMKAYDLMQNVAALTRDGMPLFGTCAGMIMMAKKISGNGAVSLGLMDIAVKRNAFGRQVDSFEVDVDVPALGKAPFHAVFIRAPLIEQCEKGVEVLAKLKDNTIIAARQGKMLVTAFHPELTNDLRFHRYFVDIIKGKNN